MSISTGFLFLSFIQALTGPSSGSTVTSCEACHDQASCLGSPVPPQRGDNFPRQSPYCVCKEGFVGDGVHCYDVNLCGDNNSSCCSHGYRWSSEEGCVDVDECSLPEPHCAQPQTCVNTPGSFDCRVPLVSSPGSNPSSRSVQFQCAGVSCPLGQDCISVSGSLRCADPCQHHSILDDDWRATDNTLGSYCDYDSVQWQGWYRMVLHNANAQIPESCVAERRCGTQVPLWITKPNPRPIDGIVERSVCGAWLGNCCYYPSNPIQAKACFGNYYVYKLVAPYAMCNLAYCSVQLPPPFLVPELVCGRSLLKVGLVSAELSSSGLDASSAHFVDPSCSASREQDGKVWYEVERRADQCGNTLTTNRTHAIYSNVLFVYHVDNMTMFSPVSVPVSCAYPLDTEASLDVAIMPAPQLEKGLSSVGSKSRASMSLYPNSSYTDPYPDGPVTLPLGSALHVGIAVEETDQSLAVVLDDCYATPSSDHEDPNRHFLIQNKCPSNHRQVRVDENGSSLKACFSALFSLFNGVNQEVFLHCSLSLCDQRTSSCSPNCSRRVYRSASQALPIKPFTIGPIIWT